MIKVSGTWRHNDYYGKVAGTQEKIIDGYTKVSGVWRKLVAPVPSGIILLSADGNVPSGWSRFASADDRFITCAGGSYAVGATGGTNTLSYSAETSTEGSHSGNVHADTNIASITDMPTQMRNISTTAGGHSHTLSITGYTPISQDLLLIKALYSSTKLPPNVMGLAQSTLSGHTVFTSSGFLRSNSSMTSAAELIQAALSSGGSHVHWDNSQGESRVLPDYDNEATEDGSHTHTINPVASLAITKAILRGVYKTTEATPTAGLIGMWEGITAPPGWALCDGNNGTSDFRDCFIQFSVSGDGSKTTGSTLSITVTIGTHSFSHSHNLTGYSYYYENTADLNVYPWSYAHNHDGTMTTGSISHTPKYYALTYIQKL